MDKRIRSAKPSAKPRSIRLAAAINAAFIVLGLLSAILFDMARTAEEKDGPEAAVVSSVYATAVQRDTIFIYEYYDISRGVIGAARAPAPAEAVGMTRDGLEGLYADFEIISITPAEVILRKTVN